MKVKLLIALLFTGIILKGQITQKWLQLGAGLNKNLIFMPSMAFDRKGNLYLAYTDQSNSQNKATLKKFDGQSWSTVSSQFTPGQAQFVTLQLDTADVPYVAFQESYPVTKMITVMKFNGSGWDTIGVRGFATADFNNPELSFAFDQNNNMFVAYRENSSGKASIARYFGVSWTTNNSTDITEGNATKLALNVETSNVYLAFNNGFRGGKLSVMTQTIGGAWVYSLGDTVLSAGPVDYVTCKRYANIAFSLTGVTFKDLSDGKAYFVSKIDNFIWSTPNPVSDGLANYVASARRRVSTFDGYLYCGYADGTVSGNATVTKVQVSVQTNKFTVGKKGFTDTLGIFAGAFYATLGIDKYDSLYLAVQSFNEYVVFKYRSINTNLVGVSESSLSNHINIFPNPAHSKVTISSTGSLLFSIKLMDVNGKTIFEKKVLNVQTFILDVFQYSKGLYFLEITQKEKINRSKLIIE